MSVRLVSAAILVVASACSPTLARPAATTPAPTATQTVAVNPAPTAARTTAPAPSPTPLTGPIQIQAFQRLRDRVGWIAILPLQGQIGTTFISLLRTSDGGATWTDLGQLPGMRFAQIRFVDERNGWGVFSVDAHNCPRPVRCRSAVFTTADGGTTWQERFSVPVSPASGGFLDELEAIDATHAWVIVPTGPCGLEGCRRGISTTTDGGVTWRSVYDRPDHVPYLLRAADRGVVFALAGRLGSGDVIVIRTVDGGATWQGARALDVVPAARGALSLEAVGPRDAWLLTVGDCPDFDCESYELLRTSDGGATWMNLGNPKAGCSGGQLRELVFAGLQAGWIPRFVSGSAPDVGPGGILVSTDGGASWRCSETPPNVTRVSASDRDHVWAVSEDRATSASSLYSSDDGGRTWRELRYR